MDPISLALLALRVAAKLHGDKALAAVNLLAEGIKSGKDVDRHMADVAARLEAGGPVDWDDVEARIRADSDDLHSPPSGG
jgi:hypothetical protein